MANGGAFWKNPVFVRFLRSRLRREEMLPSIAVVVLISGCLVAWSVGCEVDGKAVPIYGLVMVEALVLLVVGSFAVATAVAQSRESGVLELLRTSRESPLITALGFVLAAAAREGVLFACTLPFLLAVSLLGWAGVGGFAYLAVSVLSSAFVCYPLAALVGGLVKNRVATLGGLLGIAIGLVCLWQPLSLMLVAPAPAVLGGARHFFGAHLPGAVFVLIHRLPLGLLLFVAAARRMRNETAAPISKPVAVGLAGLVTFLVLGWVLEPFAPVSTDIDVLWAHRALPPLYAGLIAAMILTLAVTPGARRIARGVRRASRSGLPSVPVWSDLAANWEPMWCFAAIQAFCGVIVAGCIGLRAASLGRDVVVYLPAYPGQMPDPLGPALLAALVSMAAVVAFASGLQYLLLRYPRTGASYFVGLLLLLWVLPMPMGRVLAAVTGDAGLGLAVMCISPLVGVCGAYAAADATGSQAALLVAVCGSLLMAAVFVALRVRAEGEARKAALEDIAGARKDDNQPVGQTEAQRT